MADERQHKLRKYKAYLEAHPDSKDKVLQVFKKLLAFPVTFELLKDTGIGKTVNAFRKEEGEIGVQARAIVGGWKELVAQGGSADQGDASPPPQPAASPPHSPEDQWSAAEDFSRPLHSSDSHSPTPGKSSSSSRTVEKSSSSKSRGSSHHHTSHEHGQKVQDVKHSSSSSSRHDKSSSSAKSDSAQRKVESAKADVANGEITKSKPSGSHGSSKHGTKDSEKHRDRSEKRESTSHAHSKSATSSSSNSKKDKSAGSTSSSSAKHKSHASSDHHHHSSSKDSKHSEKGQSEKGHSEKGHSEKGQSEKGHSEKGHSEKGHSSHRTPSKDAKKDSVERGSSEKHKHSDQHESKSSHSSSKSSSSSKSPSKDEGSQSRKRKAGSSKDRGTATPVKKQLLDTASAVINDNTKEMSFEDFMNFDVAAAMAATKKKPAVLTTKTSPVASTSRASSSKPGSRRSSSSSSGAGPSQSSSSKRQLPETEMALELPLPPPKQMKFDIMASLPETQADYRPLPFYSLLEDKRKITAAEVDPMQIGTKTKSARQVYSGRKHGPTEVKRLFDLSMQCLFENIDSLEDVGGVPFDIMKPVLDRCSAMQLLRIESFNPQFEEEEGSSELWKRHCERDFKTKMSQKDDTMMWKDFYTHLLDEREAKFEALKANMSASVSRVSNEKRKTQLAYVDTVAKAPRSIRQKQIRYGTGKVGTMGDEVMTGPVKTGFTRAKQPVTAAPVPAAPKQVKLVAPMMQKSLKMMKRLRR